MDSAPQSLLARLEIRGRSFKVKLRYENSLEDWVFAFAVTNVEYTRRVGDAQMGAHWSFANPLGTASPAITDSAAFATCP